MTAYDALVVVLATAKHFGMRVTAAWTHRVRARKMVLDAG